MDVESTVAQFIELWGQAYHRFYRRIPVGQYRLTSESMTALHHFVEAGPLTVAEAAAHLERSQSAMSEMIDRLERRGLVARVADQRDRRRTLVWLTKEGMVALNEAQQVLSEVRLREAFSALDAEQRKTLIEMLGLLVDGQFPQQRESE